MHHLRNLHFLRIHKCENLSNASLIHFKDVKALEILDCEKINSEGAESLRPNSDNIDEFGNQIEFYSGPSERKGNWRIERKIIKQIE